MPKPQPFPVVLKPGVVKTEADRVVEGRWTDADKVRFVGGLPEKIGGWSQLTDDPNEDGMIRAMHAWRDTRSIKYLGAGTYKKLFIYDTLYTAHDVTPIEADGELTDPFTTVDTETTVTVTDTNHGRSIGDTVIFDGADAVGGITIDGAYLVTGVVDSDNYTIEHSAPATSSDTGGGTVAYEYELAIGVEYGALSFGYGVGGYGLEGYGEARTSSTVSIEPRIWALDNFGEDLIGSVNGGSVYAWDASAGTPLAQRAMLLADAPDDVRFMFVTAERFAVALRDNLIVSWSDIGDYTVWSPTATNQANSRTLGIGTKLVAGAVIGPRLSGIWTDNAFYTLQYTGSKFVHDTQLRGVDCGLAAPNGQITANGIAYWMGAANFYLYNGAVQPIPNVDDIKDFVFDALRADRVYQCQAVHNPRFHEVMWLYTGGEADDPNLYVIYNYREQHWTVGTLTRVSGAYFQHTDTRPIMAGSDGHLYQHEEGTDAVDAAIDAYIVSGRVAIREGQDLIDVEGLVPDFFEQAGVLEITLQGWDRLRDAAPIDEVEIALADDSPLEDFRFHGRYFGLTIRSNSLGGDFRMGKPVLLGKVKGSRR